jgi:dolichol-phosphate mannosyltransferase
VTQSRSHISCDTSEQARYLVVLPTYNERDTVPHIVPQILSQDPRLDVLVVDDNSPDGTGDVAQLLADGDSRVEVLHRPAKEGLGRAYLAGFEWALARNFELIFEMDADFSHRPEHLASFLEAADRFDVVAGSRYVDGRVTVINWPMSRLLISYFGCWYARAVTGLPLRDATGGFTCWHRRVLEGIDLSRIQSNGYAFQIELKFRAWKRGFSLTEIPIIFTERDKGESKMSKSIVREAVWRVWKLWLLDRFGRL